MEERDDTETKGLHKLRVDGVAVTVTYGRAGSSRQHWLLKKGQSVNRKLFQGTAQSSLSLKSKTLSFEFLQL